jgi:hypothetical protein
MRVCEHTGNNPALLSSPYHNARTLPLSLSFQFKPFYRPYFKLRCNAVSSTVYHWSFRRDGYRSALQMDAARVSETLVHGVVFRATQCLPVRPTNAKDLIDKLVTPPPVSDATISEHPVHKIHRNTISPTSCESDKREWTIMMHGSSRMQVVTNFTRRFTAERSPVIISEAVKPCSAVCCQNRQRTSNTGT